MSNIDISDIDNTWCEINDNYKDFHDRMSFLSKKSDLNENKNVVLRDKVHLLISDMKDMILSIEKICNYMDSNNVSKGVINISINDINARSNTRSYTGSNFDNFED